MRRRLIVVGIGLLVVLVYVAIVMLDAANTRSEPGGTSGEPQPDSVILEMSPVAVNGPGERLSVDVRVFPQDSIVVDEITLTKDLTVIVSPIDGTQSIELEAGTLALQTRTVSIPTRGTVENWPFDRYDANLRIIAYTTVDGVKEEVPVFVEWSGSLSGWNFAVSQNDELTVPLTMADGTEEDVPTIDIGATRSGSTFAFGFLLLGLLVVMPVLVLFVAIRAFTGRRKVEATLTSWMGAMLFAVVPLRGFLPGSPPIGSWIDFLVVLWVIVALITGLSIYVLAWNRWGTPATGLRRPPPPDDDPR
ncbi:DUF4436 family protein [Herbiconiux sp. YIM B11900]|uniref:DUF4436 family protein n=1 Tax=Herbiconiux sp. YIM B11900 TaxID=3404131 RepID=UPI003F85916A